MQKWEYSILRAVGPVLTDINDQHVGKMKVAPIGIKGPNLLEHLSQMGQEGWEIVGVAGDQNSGLNFVLKRPL